MDFRDVLRVSGVKAKGFGIIGKLAMQDCNLTIEAKAIYAYFCSYAGAGTTAFPSVSKIIADLGIGEKRYYKHFKGLIQNGYIQVEQEIKPNGKFSHNIYTLIENPVPIIESISEEKKIERKQERKKPSSQNDSTVEKPSSQNDGAGQKTLPSSHFACSENDGTNNNIYSLKSTNKDIYNSISQSNNIYTNDPANKKTNDRQMEAKRHHDELHEIIHKAEIHHLPTDNQNPILQAIKLLYFNKKGIKNNNSYIPQEIIKEDLKRINYHICQHAWSKFQKAAANKQIKNSVSYLASCIYDSIFSMDSDIHAELKREGVI